MEGRVSLKPIAPVWSAARIFVCGALNGVDGRDSRYLANGLRRCAATSSIRSIRSIVVNGGRSMPSHCSGAIGLSVSLSGGRVKRCGSSNHFSGRSVVAGVRLSPALKGGSESGGPVTLGRNSVSVPVTVVSVRAIRLGEISLADGSTDYKIFFITTVSRRSGIPAPALILRTEDFCIQWGHSISLKIKHYEAMAMVFIFRTALDCLIAVLMLGETVTTYSLRVVGISKDKVIGL